MATTHYYVDTGSTSGGDGTTSAITGANRAYHGLQAALTARALALAGDIVVFHCAASGGAADSNNSDLDFTGWSGASATSYIVIQVDSVNRHAGIYDTTKYRNEGTPANTYGSAPPPYTRFIGLQCLNNADDVNLTLFRMNGISSQGTQVLYCIGRWADKNYTYGNNRFVQLLVDNTGDPCIIANCLFYGGVGTHGRTGCTGVDGQNTKAVVYSCTFAGPGASSDSASVFCPDGYSKITAINNLVVGWHSFGSPNGTGTDYNATDLAAASGKTHDRVSQTFTFVDAVGTPKKYQITSADTGAKGFGTDLSGDATFPFPDDITGTTRTDPWDIGAFIFQAAVAPKVIPAFLRGFQAVNRASNF